MLVGGTFFTFVPCIDITELVNSVNNKSSQTYSFKKINTFQNRYRLFYKILSTIDKKLREAVALALKITSNITQS